MYVHAFHQEGNRTHGAISLSSPDLKRPPLVYAAFRIRQRRPRYRVRRGSSPGCRTSGHIGRGLAGDRSVVQTRTKGVSTARQAATGAARYVEFTLSNGQTARVADQRRTAQLQTSAGRRGLWLNLPKTASGHERRSAQLRRHGRFSFNRGPVRAYGCTAASCQELPLAVSAPLDGSVPPVAVVHRVCTKNASATVRVRRHFEVVASM